MKWPLAGLLLVAASGNAAERRLENLLSDPALLASPSDLRLVESKTSTIYAAQKGEWQFNLHSYLAYYQGKFWAIWSSGRVDEDSPTQIIRYSTSAGGHHWSQSQVLADDPDGPDKPGSWIARGIFVDKGKLTALLAYFEGQRTAPQGRESWVNLRLMRYEWNGKAWKQVGLYAPNCMNNYPPQMFGSHLFMTCRDSFAAMYTAQADPADERWTVTKLPGVPPADRMSEPSSYVDPEGVAHLIFRDAGGSHFLHASISSDQGRTWSAPVRTNYPDTTSKNIAGRLSNGWYFLINNPDPKKRDPLAISFSRDGWSFGNPMALRKGAAPRRFEGRSKNGGFQYPHVLERNGSLWVIYSTAKEDIQVSEFKLSAFSLPKY